jgi:transcriptional regulator with XRE-family HTH domain
MRKVRELLSANIKAGRKKSGFTQEKLAEIAGLSVQTVHDIEGCRTWVSDKTLGKLSEALNVDIFELLLPDLDEVHAKTKVFLPLMIKHLRELMKNDVDKRIDQFFSEIKDGIQ